ncbi:MAG TPA: PACE efflux transporter [Aromatoleum sp.]|uniref:PACE efflux transporter n=1 Tax=Aromatoleum sp. TaxID=2307007 RepID=UPI002B49F702|nr:PACE efflux transporter [Aromatoleum sp.]HJV24876.1 PACE efflux transporter [Aromatoleum sp.]
MSAHSPQLRSFRDRARQIVLFEVGGLLLITPPFAWATGAPLLESSALMAVMALLAAVWNTVFNTSFDWIEGRLTGRTADRRPVRLRALHAVGFEGGLLLLTLPVIVLWTGLGWAEALVADLALAAAYVVYAFAFNLAYDRLFPIQPARRDAVHCAD